MGADLYITALYAPTRNEWERGFERAVRARDGATNEVSRKAAQLRVEHAYEQVYSRGYFRDSYNDWNLLWKFGLSWWNDVIPILDAEDRLSPQQVTSLLGMLKEREPKFEAAVGQLKPRDRAYFRERYAELRRFLNEAVALKQPVVCSL